MRPEKKIDWPPIVFFSDGFDWPLKGNRYWFPYYWSRIAPVLVVTPPVSWRAAVSQILVGRDSLEEISPNLSVFRPAKFNFGLEEVIRKFSCSKPIFWHFYPEIFSRAVRSPHCFDVYHLVDLIWQYPFYYPAPDDRRKAKQLNYKVIRQADLVLTSSLYLKKICRKLNSRTFLVGNGSRTELIADLIGKVRLRPRDLTGIKPPVVGLVGNMTGFRFDFSLVEFLARKMPQLNFVLIGPTDRKLRLNELAVKLDNFHWLGPKPFEALPAYFKSFNLGLVPYKRNEHTRGILPIKLFEFLAAGLPVVAADLYSLRAYRKWVYLAADRREFVEQISRALAEERGELKNQRKEFALDHSWEKIVEKSAVMVKSFLP
ncbi:MAG: glycosyltransferase [Candidatus Pacebacteria bacterium]|nr:glycosyltransferase [Candidatus Paceibacterota bacterium]